MAATRDVPAAWVVAGAPGAGKSTVARALCAGLRPPAALLDKDVLFSGLVAEVLAAHGRPYVEREGEWYDAHVKVHEYAALTAGCAQVRAVGCAVAVVAPFTTQVRDPRRWPAWVAELGGEPVRLVWVTCSGPVLRDRLRARGRDRDAGKLADWTAFVARMRLDEPPPVPHVAVRTDPDAPALDVQLAPLLGAVAAGAGP